MNQILLSKNAWMVTTDTVMGGLSTLSVVEKEQGLTFRGEIVHRNNGGFVSSRVIDGEVCCPQNAKGIKVVWSGDERGYRLILHERNRVAREYFEVDLDTSVQHIAWEEFRYRRRTLSDPDRKICPEQITSVGLLLSNTMEGRVQFDLVSLEWWVE